MESKYVTADDDKGFDNTYKVINSQSFLTKNASCARGRWRCWKNPARI